MRAVLAAALLLLAPLVSIPASAQTPPPSSIYAGKVTPLGYCQLTSLATSTALTACPNGIPTGANFVDIIVEAQSIRYRTDSVAPTSTIGMLLAAGTDKVFALNNLGTFNAIQVTAGAIIDAEFFK